jgi:lipoprotein-releasing system permease protein
VQKENKLFLFIKGALLGFGGILLGNLLGFILMKIQIELDIIKIPSSVYFMSKVPFLIAYDTFILISVLTFALCIAASVIPSIIASRIKPITALRFG